MSRAPIPLFDLAQLRGSPAARSLFVDNIGKACRDNGFFQVINHDICPSVTGGALRAAESFFDLPREEKMALTSDDITKPVRYTSSTTKTRSFLKQYAHPLQDWIHLWPTKPPEYRESMGKYAVEARRMALEVMEAIMESLGLGRVYLKDKMEEGLQVMTVNSYPVCRNSDEVLGIHPHSDYSLVTVILQSLKGLEELEPETDAWRMIPEVPDSLLVHVGNYLEVISNGRYKSAVHRVALSPDNKRVSIASLHALAMDEKVGVAAELVDEQHPEGYKDSSFDDFLRFLASNDGFGGGRCYLDTLKIV